MKQTLYKLNIPYFKKPKRKSEHVKEATGVESKEKDDKKKSDQVISQTMIRLKGSFSSRCQS